MPDWLRDALAVSTACGLATAPVLWFQFHAVPLLSVPANALAAPAMVPVLGFAFAAAGLEPLAPSAASALAWLNGWCAAYLAGCARLVGGLPFAQIRSGQAALLAAASLAAVGAYAWRRWPRRL
jgi:competence protein ComEC